MKNRRSTIRVAVIMAAVGVTGLILKAQAPAAQTPTDQAGQGGGRGAGGRGGGGRGGGFTGPSVSVRPPDQGLPRTAATTLLGWRLGVRTDALGPLSFWEAVRNADVAGLAYVEGVSTQRVSPEIPKNLDYNLSAAEVDKVKARLNDLRLRMPAYLVETLPGDGASRRKLFEFAKGMGIDMIVCTLEPASLAELDELANEFAINVAVSGKDPKGELAAIEGLSKRIGLGVDLGSWMEAGFKPLAGLAQLKDRVLVANLRDRGALGGKSHNVTLGTGVANLTPFLLELSRLQPPEAPPNWPPPPGKDGATARAEVKPLFLTLDPAGAADPISELSHSVAAYDKAVPLAIYYRMDELARVTSISTPEKVPAEQKQRINAAIPRQALAKPKKPRKLLVVDLDVNGSFYHGSIPLANLSLQLMAEYTGAFTPVFSNDLDNLKYPKIKQYDAVYLNNIQGPVFTDPEVIEGLVRFVREGGGVAALHAATWASQDVHEFGEMMGATSGAHKYNGEPGALRVDDPDSPLTKQFGGKGFNFLDEYYHFIPTGPFSREKVHVLLSLDPEKTELTGNRYKTRPDNDYAMAWIRDYGKGRVFTCALGHRPEFYETPNMQQMVLAGVQFILGDLAADTTPGNKPAMSK